MPRCLFIFLLLMCDSYLKSPAFRLNAVKDCFFFFERGPRRLLLFDLKHAKFVRGGTPSIKCNRILCFSKERLGANFCPSYLEGGVLSSVYGIDSICWFYYTCDQFFITFVASTRFDANKAVLTNQIKLTSALVCTKQLVFWPIQKWV